MPIVSKNSVIAMLSRLLSDYGVGRIISSPGSRSFPLLTAFSRNDRLTVDSVVDERSAAFSALGIADTTGCPVGLLCTSGTALLNYAPAIAEAYYRNIPLIVISADRPKEWIGQNDGQTIVQPEALKNIVAGSFDISNDDQSELSLHYTNRVINEALTLATGSSRPVHINVHLGEPLVECDESLLKGDYRKISTVAPDKRLSTDCIRDLVKRLASPAKVMIFIGQYQPDRRLNDALGKLSNLPNVVIVGQNTSNIHIPNAIRSIDAVLSQMGTSVAEEMMPDIMITAGGGAISRKFKELLRNSSLKEHWNVDPVGDTVDCFMKLSQNVIADPGLFFQQLAAFRKAYGDKPSDYARRWRSYMEDAAKATRQFLNSAAWGDFKAIDRILSTVPSKWNVQCSNGMSIRYCDLFDCSRFHRFSANRGCNGIDGSTSTAIGASSVFNGTTLLITGDMSAMYDVSALMSPLLTARFKMIIVNNNGGDIFRCIRATRDVPERERHISVGLSPDWQSLACAGRMRYFRASSDAELQAALPSFIRENEQPCMLVVSTPENVNSKIYSEYLKRNK